MRNTASKSRHVLRQSSKARQCRLYAAVILTIRRFSGILLYSNLLSACAVVLRTGKGQTVFICWCGAMAAQLICNQWVAGSTPVTSSKKNPAIYRQNDGVYRGIFAFICVAKCPESATNSGKNCFEQLCAPLFCVLRLYPLCSGLPPEPKKAEISC